MAKAESRRGRLAGRLLAVAAVLAALAAAGIWLARDLPRRRVERALAGRLGAEVRLGGLSAEGLHDFVLRDLEVRRMRSQPRLDRIRIAKLAARGSLNAFLEGKFDVLRISGLEVRLARPPPGPPPPPAEPVEVLVGRLEIEDGAIVVAADDATTALGFTASLREVGGELAGEIRARAAEADLLPALALLMGGAKPFPLEGCSLQGFEASLGVSEGGRSAVLDASARRIALRRDGRDLAIPSPSVHGESRQAGPAGPVSVEAKARLPFVESMEASATLDSKSWALLGARASVKGLDLAAAAALVAALPEGASVRGRADLTIVAESAGAVSYDLAARLDRAAVTSGGGELAVEDATVAARGSARIEEGRASGPLRAEIVVPRLTGQIAGISFPAGALPVRASLEARVATGPAAPGARPSSPVGPSDHSDGLLCDGTLSIETGGVGRIEARGNARLPAAGPEADVRFTWNGVDLERLAALAREAGFPTPAGLTVRGKIAAVGTFSGSFAAPAIDARIEASPLRLDAAAGAGVPGRAWSLSDARAAAHLSWRPPARRIEIASLEVRGSAAVPPLGAVPVSLAATGALATAPPALTIGRAVAEASGLARLTGSGELLLSGQPHGSLKLRAEELDLAGWQSFLRPLIGDPAPGYSLRGAATAELEAKLVEGGRFAGSGTAAVRKSGFASEDGSKALEGLDTSWELAFDAGKGEPALHVRARAPVGGFQLLWGTFFLDGSALASSLSAEARATIDGPAGAGTIRWTGTAAWTLPEGPRLEASIDAPPQGPVTGTVDLAVADLGSTVDRYLRATLGDSVPFLRKIEAGGSLHAALRGTIAGGEPALAGRVEAKGVRLAGTGGYAEVEGLDLDLPIDLAWGAAGPDGERPLRGAEGHGSLRFGRASVGGLEIPPGSTGLSLRADSIALDEGLGVTILGGAIGFEKLKLLDLLRPSRRVETGILLSKLDLGEASRALGFLPLEGTVDGHLPAVSISPSELHVTGGGEISIFGGKLAIGDISGKDVLSRYPKLAFSASFHDIDLGQVTRRFDFGEMAGTLEGSLKDCELFRGTPVRFEAEIRSVAREGVSRTINVKAINNIAILGTGGSVGIFDRGIHRFFDRYTYEALGIRMSLENDVFLLRGLERRGDRELFLKGRLPFPIDVVNAQPGRTVSFRTMLERVRSLDFSAATTKP